MGGESGAASRSSLQRNSSTRFSLPSLRPSLASPPLSSSISSLFQRASLTSPRDTNDSDYFDDPPLYSPTDSLPSGHPSPAKSRWDTLRNGRSFSRHGILALEWFSYLPYHPDAMATKALRPRRQPQESATFISMTNPTPRQGLQ